MSTSATFELGRQRGESPMPRSGFRAVFFDLDGTLLPMELEDFLGSYFTSLGAFAASKGCDVSAFLSALKSGIGAMVGNDGSRTNSDAFWCLFNRIVVDSGEVDRDWLSILNEYYEYEFPKIGKDCIPNPAAEQAVNTLAQKGYTLVLATMPMFPRRAVEHRLAWAGVDPSLFSRVTTYENSCCVKPHLEYCAENLAACGLRGSEVLMVGNNTVEDVAFAHLGAQMYLAVDQLLDPVGFDLSSVGHGTLAEFAEWAQSLPNCEHPAESVDTGVMTADSVAAVLQRDSLVDEEARARAVEASGSFNAQAMSNAYGMEK